MSDAPRPRRDPIAWLAGWYGGLSIARKLRLFPVLAAAALALVLSGTVSTGREGERRLERLATAHYPRVEATWRREQTLATIQRAFQDAVAGRDPDALLRADSLAGVFRATLARRDADAVRLDAHFTRYFDAGRDVSARLLAGEVGDDVSAAAARLHVAHRALVAALAAGARSDRALMAHALAEESDRQRVTWLAALALTVGSVTLLGVLSRIASRSITEPLREAVRAADRVAAGDLEVELPASGGDEVGRLLASMGHMVVNLRSSEDRLVHQATHDALTGLVNRVLFRERVAEALARLGEATAPVDRLAVLYIDLDNFKNVNDVFGHGVGDELLVEVTRRLRSATRGCDTVARLGGDEFAVLLGDLRQVPQATTVARRIVDAVRAPVRVANAEVRVGASVGITYGGPGRQAEDLLREADMAMYAAKHDGKGRYETYHIGMHEAAHERLALETDLREALEREALEGGSLVLHFQPIVRLASERPVGVEALVRWPHPTRGLVSPAHFVPLAEATGLVVPLGRWVLEEACRQGVAWQPPPGSDARPFHIGVNVSPRQLRDPRFVSDVRAALAATGLPPAALVLEITESVMLDDRVTALERLHALKALGVSLALDDFGTGYSSLSYLHDLPIDVLKIDQSFVADHTRADNGRRPITHAIVALGRALGLRIVAEGIEQPAQAAALAALGCDDGQGYHFARALPAGAVGPWLAGRGVRHEAEAHAPRQLAAVG